MTALKLIAKEEGFSSKPYLDHLGVMTFGHGLTYITEEESEMLMKTRITNRTTELTREYPWFRNLTDNRKIVIVSMAYQLGMPRFGKFKNMIKALEKGDIELAAKEMKNSLAYEQTTNRWDRQIEMFLKG